MEMNFRLIAHGTKIHVCSLSLENIFSKALLFRLLMLYLILISVTKMSSTMMQSTDSNSEANSRPFQGGLQANGGSEAVNASYTAVILDSATSRATGGSSSASNDLPAKPKRRKSDPQGWKAQKIKKAKAEGT